MDSSADTRHTLGNYIPSPNPSPSQGVVALKYQAAADAVMGYVEGICGEDKVMELNFGT